MIDGLIFDESSRTYNKNEETTRYFISHTNTQLNTILRLGLRDVPVNDIMTWLGHPDEYTSREAMVTGWSKGEQVTMSYDMETHLLTFDPAPHDIFLEGGHK